MSRVAFTKGFILQNQQQRIQWANFDRAHHPIGKIIKEKAVGATNACQLHQRNILKGKISSAPTFTRQFHLFSAHSTQFTKSETFHRYQQVENVPEGLFRGLLDRFNGITVLSNKEFEKNVDFPKKLKKSLDFWISNKYRAIWFHILTEHAEWISHLAQEKFEFHHARKGTLVMCRWLPTDEKTHIPLYAHTLVGVGGLVFNNENEILVVTDRYALVPNAWKLPGGYMEPGESIGDAAIREVWEETAIKCIFETVVAIRHSHGGAFNCADMYVVVGLKPQSLEYKCCDSEIVKVQWMKIEDFLKHPNVHGANRQFARILKDYYKRGVRLTYEIGRHSVLKKDYQVFFMTGKKKKTKVVKIKSPRNSNSKDKC